MAINGAEIAAGSFFETEPAGNESVQKSAL
jgi:hypothetical protein